MLQKLLNAFRSGARTVGLSPKALAAPIGAAITALLALVGLTPQVIGDAIGVNAPAVAAAILTVAASACGSTPPRDQNYGSDLGADFHPPVVDAATE